jgi:hypothetical protein
MKVTVEINTKNDAFADDVWGFEVRRILKEAGRYLEDISCTGPVQVERSLQDINGNTVGTVKVEEQ